MSTRDRYPVLQKSETVVEIQKRLDVDKRGAEQHAERQVGTIDLTPSWTALVPVFCAVLENPAASLLAKDTAREQLALLAQFVDRVNAARRAP